jgi:hypothetical protein
MEKRDGIFFISRNIFQYPVVSSNGIQGSTKSNKSERKKILIFFKIRK